MGIPAGPCLLLVALLRQGVELGFLGVLPLIAGQVQTIGGLLEHALEKAERCVE